MVNTTDTSTLLNPWGYPAFSMLAHLLFYASPCPPHDPGAPSSRGIAAGRCIRHFQCARHSLSPASQSMGTGPAALASPGSLSGTQDYRTSPDLLSQNPHFRDCLDHVQVPILKTEAWVRPESLHIYWALRWHECRWFMAHTLNNTLGHF